MNTRIAKSIALAAATGLLLTSLGASAAGHKCPKGQKWDKESKTCVEKKAVKK
jgi:hypothetical protein